MKIRLTTLAISILFKPAVLVALFAMVSRVTELSGFGREVIGPAASSISEVTPLTYDYAVALVTALIAFSLMRILSAVWCIVSAPAR
jgi:hypothetical protein